MVSIPLFLSLFFLPVACMWLGVIQSIGTVVPKMLYLPWLTNSQDVSGTIEKSWVGPGNQPTIVFIILNPNHLMWFWYYPHWLSLSAVAFACYSSGMWGQSTNGESEQKKAHTNNYRLPVHPPPQVMEARPLSSALCFLCRLGCPCHIILRVFTHIYYNYLSPHIHTSSPASPESPTPSILCWFVILSWSRNLRYLFTFFQLLIHFCVCL